MALASNFIALPELQANFPVDVVRDYVPIGYIRRASDGDRGQRRSRRQHAAGTDRASPKSARASSISPPATAGSILHLTGEWLRIAGGIDVTLLHYPAASQAITDVLGGRVHIIIDAITSMKGAIDSGRIKPLAVAAKKRLYNFPDLPVVADTFAGFEGDGLVRADGAAGYAPRRSRRRSAAIYARCWRARRCRSGSRISAPISVRRRRRSSRSSSASSSRSGGR